MKERILTLKTLYRFQKYLLQQEKSTATVEKYLRDARAFSVYAGARSVTKELTVAYKQFLQEKGYALRSINSMLASVNSLLEFLGWQECKVKSLRQQQQTYSPESKELSRAEYLRLLDAAKPDRKLWLILQTICGTGIRVSELQFFTVEAVCCGEINVRCKGKSRVILLPGKLRKLLKEFADRENIRSGAIFLSHSGKPMSRCSIWAQMKALCSKAGVSPEKVFPHNLRKLFARTFYAMEKDIAKLADLLGHSSINTTRIYIMTTGAEHRKKLDLLGLVV